MDIIDNNRQSVSFGIAFRPRTNNCGIRVAEMLDLQEEIKMYKSITDKLNTDVLEKTSAGVKSNNFRLEKEDNKKYQMMRYFDKNGELFFFNDGTKVQNIDKHFSNLRNSFDRFFNK